MIAMAGKITSRISLSRESTTADQPMGRIEIATITSQAMARATTRTTRTRSVRTVSPTTKDENTQVSSEAIRRDGAIKAISKAKHQLIAAEARGLATTKLRAGTTEVVTRTVATDGVLKPTRRMVAMTAGHKGVVVKGTRRTALTLSK